MRACSTPIAQLHDSSRDRLYSMVWNHTVTCRVIKVLSITLTHSRLSLMHEKVDHQRASRERLAHRGVSNATTLAVKVLVAAIAESSSDVKSKGYSKVRCKVQNTWTGELSEYVGAEPNRIPISHPSTQCQR